MCLTGEVGADDADESEVRAGDRSRTPDVLAARWRSEPGACRCPFAVVDDAHRTDPIGECAAPCRLHDSARIPDAFRSAGDADSGHGNAP